MFLIEDSTSTPLMLPKGVTKILWNVTLTCSLKAPFIHVNSVKLYVSNTCQRLYQRTWQLFMSHLMQIKAVVKPTFCVVQCPGLGLLIMENFVKHFRIKINNSKTMRFCGISKFSQWNSNFFHWWRVNPEMSGMIYCSIDALYSNMRPLLYQVTGMCRKRKEKWVIYSR